MNNLFNDPFFKKVISSNNLNSTTNLFDELGNILIKYYIIRKNCQDYSLNLKFIRKEN